LLDPKQDVDAHATTYNIEIRTIIKQFRQWRKAFMANAQTPRLTISFYYASKGDEVDPEVEKRADKLIQRVHQLYEGDCKFRFINAKKLLGMLRQTRSEPVKLEFFRDLGSGILGDAYLCLVPIKAF